MKKSGILFCFLFTLLLSFHAKSQNTESYYRQAYSELCSMLNGSQQPDFKRAVFITENAWHEEGLSYEGFCETIISYKKFCLQIKENDSLLYVHNDREKVKVHAAVFRFMTDTIPVVINDTTYYHLPFTYNFDTLEHGDNWKNMFVNDLMRTGQGNCHSLPILYKLICEEMGQKAWLSFTPNHLYIKVQNRQNGWHNLELTSGISPVDGYMVIANYIHLDALRNAVYMDTLGLKQSIAMCLVDLAQGYRRKATNPDPAFMLECCETALHYYPLFMNALLLKAEIMTQQYQSQTDKGSLLRREMENLYARIHQLGYRKWTKAGFEQKNPFEKFGYTPRMPTVSNGRFAEAHDIRDTVEIGLVAFDVKRSKIVKFIEHDTLPPDVTAMFLSCDPMQDMYAWITPYHYCLNNPLRYTDPTGMFVEDGNYYDRQGKYLGTDGIDDGKIYLLNEGRRARTEDNRISWGGTLAGNHAENLKSNSTEVGGLIIMNRTEQGTNYTSGEFSTIGGQNVEGYMMEPKGPSTSQSGQNQRIPEGVYNLDNHSSAKYPANFILSNGDVSKSRGILIHEGKSSSWSVGCLLPGSGVSGNTISGSNGKMTELRTFINSIGVKDVKLIINNNIPGPYKCQMK